MTMWMTAEPREFRSTSPFQEFFRTEAADRGLLVTCAREAAGKAGRCGVPGLEAAERGSRGGQLPKHHQEDIRVRQFVRLFDDSRAPT
jgi:hypothetical protein